jgi:hypothetical protein
MRTRLSAARSELFIPLLVSAKGFMSPIRFTICFCSASAVVACRACDDNYLGQGVGTKQFNVGSFSIPSALFIFCTTAYCSKYNQSLCYIGLRGHVTQQ